MKLVSINYKGCRISFLPIDEVVPYLQQVPDDFLEDPEERYIFQTIFPDKWKVIENQVERQTAQKITVEKG